MTLKGLILSAVGLGAMLAPASATIQIAIDVNGHTFFCGSGMACDINPTAGTVQIAPTTLDGLFFAGEIATSTSPGGPDILNNSVLISDNTTSAIAHVTVAVSDTGFVGPVKTFSLAGSGVWQNTVGSSLTFNYFADTANAQGAATAFDTPGTLLDSFTSKATSVAQGFSLTNDTGPFSAAGPFSMTLQSSYDLMPGGELVNRGLTETMTPAAIPELTTVVMVGTGLALLAFMGVRRKHGRLAF